MYKKKNKDSLKMLKKHFNVAEEDAEDEYENEDKASPPATFLPRRQKEDDYEEDEDEDDDESHRDVMDTDDEIEEGGEDAFEDRSNNDMRSYPEDESEIMEDEGMIKPSKAQRKKMSAVEIAKRITRKSHM